MSNIPSHQFRVAILGAGNISAEHADTLTWLKNTKLVAVCDLEYDRAMELSDKYGNPDVYVSVEEMLEKSKPDVVHILLPPGEHVRFASQCLLAGSHVFVEKPIGITTAESKELRDIAKDKGLTIGVNHNMVYLPVVQQLIEKIRENRFGRIVHVNIAYSMPPSKIINVSPRSFFMKAPQNPLLEWAVHPLSVVNYILGKVKRAGTLISGKHNVDTDKHLYTTWQSSLECDRGTAQLLISVGQGFDYWWMDVLGEDAFAHIDFLNNSMIITEYTPYRPAVAMIRDAFIKSASLFGNAINNMKNYVMSGLGRPVEAESSLQAAMRNSMRSFYDALSGNVVPNQGIDEGIEVIEYCEHIFDSDSATVVEKECIDV